MPPISQKFRRGGQSRQGCWLQNNAVLQKVREIWQASRPKVILSIDALVG